MDSIKFKLFLNKLMCGTAVGASALLVALAYSRPFMIFPDFSSVSGPAASDDSGYTREEKVRIAARALDGFMYRTKPVLDTAAFVYDGVTTFAGNVAADIDRKRIIRLEGQLEKSTSEDGAVSYLDDDIPQAEGGILSRSLNFAVNGIDHLLEGVFHDGTASAAVCPDGFEKAVVIRVCDGDTLFVRITEDNRGEGTAHVGEDAYVRLIGVNTPESSAAERVGYAKATDAGEEASAYTKGLVKPNSEIWLSSDRSDTDRYGRLLRYVWLTEPEAGDSSDASAVSEKTLNGKLLTDGYAETMYVNDVKYAYVFDDLQSRAVLNGAGLWGKDWKGKESF